MSSDQTTSYRSLLAAVAMGVSAVLFLMAVLITAGPWASAATVAQDEAPEESSDVLELDAERTPAHDFIDTFTDQIGDRLDTTGVVPGALPPYPLVCGQPELVPVVSTAMTVDRRAQVFVAVYPAGQGGAELERQLHAGDCPGGRLAVAEVAGPGWDARQVQAAWDGKRSIVRAWRHGDVVAYTVVDQGHRHMLDGVSTEVDALIAGALEGRCVDPSSSVADANRSPFHAPDGYRGYLIAEPVAIDTPGVPEPPEGAVVDKDDEFAVDIADYPFEAPEVAEVDLPAVPSYPVWPELPEALEVPDAPEQPADPQVSTKVEVAHDDVAGPGCGWEFTGELAPPFDADRAHTDGLMAIGQAQRGLEQDAERWVLEVLDYWQSWPGYLAEVAQYRDYVAEVEEVALAWAVIAEAWDEYREAVAQWEQDVEAHAGLVAEREALEGEWEEQVAACEASADEAAAAEAAQDAVADPALGGESVISGDVEACEELERPALLDEPLPGEPVEPEEPADPRP